MYAQVQPIQPKGINICNITSYHMVYLLFGDVDF